VVAYVSYAQPPAASLLLVAELLTKKKYCQFNVNFLVLKIKKMKAIKKSFTFHGRTVFNTNTALKSLQRRHVNVFIV